MRDEAEDPKLSDVVFGVARGLGALVVIALFFLGFLLAPGIVAIALLVTYLVMLARGR